MHFHYAPDTRRRGGGGFLFPYFHFRFYNDRTLHSRYLVFYSEFLFLDSTWIPTTIIESLKLISLALILGFWLCTGSFGLIKLQTIVTRYMHCSLTEFGTYIYKYNRGCSYKEIEGSSVCVILPGVRNTSKAIYLIQYFVLNKYV